jgi:hypothetical protein
MADKITLADAQQGVARRFVDMGDNTFAELMKAVLGPIPYQTLGHYRTIHRTGLVNAQAANSRLFSMRNTHVTNLIIPTRVQVKWLQTGAHTAALEDSVDIFKCTGFSVSDSVNTVTPTASRKRTSSMAAAPGAAEIRGVTVAGAAAGMTGGALTKDAAPYGQLPAWLLAALPTAAMVPFWLYDDDHDEATLTHPFVYAQNEGIEIENRVLLGAAAASSLYIDFSWAEVTVF